MEQGKGNVNSKDVDDDDDDNDAWCYLCFGRLAEIFCGIYVTLSGLKQLSLTAHALPQIVCILREVHFREK